MGFKNKYYFLRHGQALSNIEGFNSSWPEIKDNPLTEEGQRQAKQAGQFLKSKNIDLIFSSDLQRTRQTAEIVGRELNLNPNYDSRLREISFGGLNGKTKIELEHIFGEKGKETPNIEKVENYYELSERMLDFLKETDSKFFGKNILIVSHEAPLAALEWKLKGISVEKGLKEKMGEKIKNGEVREIN